MGIETLDHRDRHSVLVKARLAPGVTRARAEHAASLVAASLTTARPEGWNPGQQFALVPASEVQVHPGVDPLLRAAAWLLIAVVGLVLLLACTNLASFLVARALDRGREIAVRRALGATRGALARQVLVESALLGLGGAAAGLVLAVVLLDVLLSLDLPLPDGMRLDLHLGLDWRALFDWRVLALTAGAGVLAGGLLGLVPAVQGTRARSRLDAQDGQQGKRCARHPQVAQRDGRRPDRHVARVARGGRAIPEKLAADVGRGPGLRPRADGDPVRHDAGRAVNARRCRATNAASARALSDAAGATAVGLVWPLPLELSSSNTNFTIDGRVLPAGREAFRADRAFVDGGFFDAVGMAMVAGRTFNDGDRRDGQPVAIISQAMARRYWTDGGALGGSSAGPIRPSATW